MFFAFKFFEAILGYDFILYTKLDEKCYKDMYCICPLGETRRRCQIYGFREHIPAHAFHAAAPQTLHKIRLPMARNQI